MFLQSVFTRRFDHHLLSMTVFTFVVLFLMVGCSSPEDDVVQIWNEYHRAMCAAEVATVRTMMAAGLGAELDGPEASAAMEMRSELVPENPMVNSVAVDGTRAVMKIDGPVDGQNMLGTISFVRESEGWKILEENWEIDLSVSFPVPDVNLAEEYASGQKSAPEAAVVMAAHDGSVTALAFTRDGQHLVSVGYDDYRLRLWDHSSGALLDEVECEHRPNDLALSPDGDAAYVVDTKGHVTEWQIQSGTWSAAQVFAGRAGRKARIAVDADGLHAVTTSWDDKAKIWDLAARTFVRALPKSEKMRGVAFSPTAPIVAAGSTTNYFMVWNLEKPAKPKHKKYKVPKVSEQSEVFAVAFSPDGRRLATGHMDASITVWDMEKGKQMHNWYVANASVMDVTFSPCGTVLATGQNNGNTYLWETASRKMLFVLPAHEGATESVAYNLADGVTLATGGKDGMIKIWR